MLVWEQGRRRFNADVKTWLLPELYNSNSASTVMTDYIKAMQAPGLPGALAKYKDVAITRAKYGIELPEGPTAKGFRHGAADTIAVGVPAELAVHNTGHDLTGLGAIFEYLGCRIALSHDA